MQQQLSNTSPLSNEELHALLILQLTEKLGPIKSKALISYTGSASAVFKEKKGNLLRIPGIGEQIVNNLFKKETWNLATEELNFTSGNDIQVIPYFSHHFAQRLKHHTNCPLILYKKGDIDLNPKRTIAIIGTRKCTEYGKHKCLQIVQGLKSTECVIISGLAYGIDSVAHKSAIDNDMTTFAVLGHGLRMIYPAQHKHLALEILEKNGCLLTQFYSRTLPGKDRFPARNFTVAALSDAVLVVESKKDGGSMITAQFAFDLNKEVFAMPGRPIDPFSQGCNSLIKKDMARLIHDATDIIDNMLWDEKKTKSKQTSLFYAMTSEEQLIHNIIEKDPFLHVDDIQYKSGFKPSKLSGILLSLELNGMIRRGKGTSYSVFK